MGNPPAFNLVKQTITATTTFDRPPRVLLVEDDFTSREFLRRVLEKTGCAVAAADCVPDAQRLFDERGAQGFDTVLTDYRMPGLTGLDLLEWLKQRDSCLTTILLTAEGEKKLSLPRSALARPISSKNLST